MCHNFIVAVAPGARYLSRQYYDKSVHGIIINTINTCRIVGFGNKNKNESINSQEKNGDVPKLTDK